MTHHETNLYNALTKAFDAVNETAIRTMELQKMSTIFGEILMSTRKQAEDARMAAEEAKNEATGARLHSEENGKKLTDLAGRLEQMEKKQESKYSVIDTHPAIRRAFQFLLTVGMSTTAGVLCAFPVNLPVAGQAEEATYVAISLHLLTAAYKKLYPSRAAINQADFHAAFSKLPCREDLTKEIVQAMVNVLPISSYKNKAPPATWALLPLSVFLTCADQIQHGMYSNEIFEEPDESLFPVTLAANGKHVCDFDPELPSKPAWGFSVPLEGLSSAAVRTYLDAVDNISSSRKSSSSNSSSSSGSSSIDTANFEPMHFCGIRRLYNAEVLTCIQLMEQQVHLAMRDDDSDDDGDNDGDNDGDEDGDEDAGHRNKKFQSPTGSARKVPVKKTRGKGKGKKGKKGPKRARKNGGGKNGRKKEEEEVVSVEDEKEEEEVVSIEDEKEDEPPLAPSRFFDDKESDDSDLDSRSSSMDDSSDDSRNNNKRKAEEMTPRSLRRRVGN